MAYSSVIFDMDGVLLNSLVDGEKWKYRAVDRALKEKDVEPENVSRDGKDAILGDKGYKACLKKSSKLGLDPREIWSLVAQETTNARGEELRKGNFELYPEAEKVVKNLHQKDIPLAVISNAPEAAVKMMIEYFELKQYFKFFAGVRNFEDLRDRKPHPNHLELAKAELKRDPFIYVGDSDSDLKAAENARMDSVWVKRGGEVQNGHTFEVEGLGEIVNRVVEDQSE
ncbi:HAD family hydrolase [Candidatus Nanohalovita haloferacivicina]|uniref:HAD family hydrolase n=1 Tax=Candidatus Nanohalovita haloferacivicina TaxID=2978046 RepID=UPI00325FCF07|nr:HAD superfamily hydrolase [Candidatus Nanohalobia archaeon BNXNv]